MSNKKHGWAMSSEELGFQALLLAVTFPADWTVEERAVIGAAVRALFGRLGKPPWRVMEDWRLGN